MKTIMTVSVEYIALLLSCIDEELPVYSEFKVREKRKRENFR